ncbi:MAG: hypothetical protein FWB73_00335 [Treponema sp.]|nr:hypothetical protein [Treponema sp.]
MPRSIKQPVDVTLLPAMSKEELLELAKANEIDVDATAETNVIVEVITKALKDEAGGDTPPKSEDKRANDPPSDKKDENQQSTGGGNGKGSVTVKCSANAGITITATTGKPITFNDDGEAVASLEDAVYLKALPGYEITN